MIMLRSVMGISLKDHLRNGEMRGRVGVECNTEVISKTTLRWFGKLMRSEEELIKRAWRNLVAERSTVTQRVKERRTCEDFKKKKKYHREACNRQE